MDDHEAGVQIVNHKYNYRQNWMTQSVSHRCPIMANCSITLSDYNSIEWLMKNEAASAPITFAEIVMVMISQNKQ